MLFFTVVAILQFFSESSSQLFGWRFLLGLALGADYVACGAMVAEFSPARKRGLLLSLLSVGWTVGYVSAFTMGYLLRNSGPNSWRIALLTSAVPSLITFLLRLRTPESPVWLARTGQLDKARGIVSKHVGSEIALPIVNSSANIKDESLANLFKSPLYRNTIIGCLFFTAQVIPGFALGTFLPLIFLTLHVSDAFTGALIYNIVLLIAVVLGMLVCDLIPRRTLLIQSFVLMSIFLAILTFWHAAPSLVIVLIFAALAIALAISGVLQVVYPPELFPTELRARGISVVIACSRIGAAVGTLFLPVVVDRFGIYVALGAFMAISIFAAIICKMWAPETLGRRLV
jgi:putative MFS transporter